MKCVMNIYNSKIRVIITENIRLDGLIDRSMVGWIVWMDDVFEYV